MSASSPGPPSPPAFSSLCFLLAVASQRPWSHCGLWSLSGSTSGRPSAVNGAKDGGCHLCTFTECCLRLRSSWILCYVALSTTEVFIIVLISQVLHCPHALPFSHHLVLPYTSPKMPYFVPLHTQHGLSRTSFASLRDASSSLKIQKPNSAVLTSEEMAFLVTADGYSFTFRGDLWEELQRLGCSPRQGTPDIQQRHMNYRNRKPQMPGYTQRLVK
ncbi:uncharacterized protein LOC123381861 isoform X2 [Felis catus]|uniref:uncharacterized protein LOC123381861 isoform X2 n=1 Tax=Felis catus TaxID=9685 RepID=UPI001D19A429|nr:uncharacterized protein LOC123381861 isoform X2 [Felis catus]